MIASLRQSRLVLLFLGLVTAVFLVLFAPPTAAFAQSVAESGIVAPNEQSVITIDALTLAFFIGSLLPFLTALATKLNASSQVKGIVNLVLAIAGGVLTAFVTSSGSLTIQEIAAAAIATYLSTQALYTGVLRKPTAALAAATPNSGLG
jgi:hypothetical protein